MTRISSTFWIIRNTATFVPGWKNSTTFWMYSKQATLHNWCMTRISSTFWNYSKQRHDFSWLEKLLHLSNSKQRHDFSRLEYIKNTIFLITINATFFTHCFNKISGPPPPFKCFFFFDRVRKFQGRASVSIYCSSSSTSFSNRSSISTSFIKHRSSISTSFSTGSSVATSFNAAHRV